MKSLDIYLWCKYNWHNPIAPGDKARDTWLEELRHMIINPLCMGELFNDAPERPLKK